ncbi:MAG: cupin domain-containing protein [Candidatus Eisenbacteria bacterium]|nr:cupin domain-containing protein [Candidatus Eisenbacteria bacterium]
MPSREELGKRIKSVRLEKGLTLKEVELLSGVSMTHTSQIERGMTSPTVGALEKLARALDKTASFFIEENALEETCRVCKPDRSILSNEEHGVRLESLSNGIPGGMLHFYHLVAEPGAKPPTPRSHAGEEAITVLKGSLEVVIGEERYRLKAGDSIHYKSDQPHYFYASNRHGAEAIWVGTAVPLF